MDIDVNVIKKNKELVERHPYLLPRNVFSDEVRGDYNYEFTLYDDIPEGWRIGFGEFLLEDLRDALVKTNYLNRFRFMQIKEKFGGLRLYCNGAPQEVHDGLRKYEYISQFIFIYCGSPRACIVDDYGWYLPLCKDCWDKQNEKREEKGHRTMSYVEASDGEFCELPDSYTVEIYSNGEETKIVYDINETVNKIKKAYLERC